jgi:deoxyribodipyrimidine photo-lyase
MHEIEQERIRVLNNAPVRENGVYVLYWCQSSRRVDSNHALSHAANIANENGLPLLVYEGLTCSYPHANDRLHTFVIEAVPGIAQELKAIHAGYFFYLRKKESEPNDLLYRLAAKARCVVTDDYPVFIPAAHNSSVPGKIGVSYLAVDSNCIVPTSVYDKREYAAYTIRPKIRRELTRFLRPLARVRLKHPWNDDLLPESVRRLRTLVDERDIPTLVAASEVNHSIAPSKAFHGGVKYARRNLKTFIEHKLSNYATDSNQPSRHGTSELSPWLHFGHISALEVALEVHEYAAEHRVNAEEFLEELIVRRELAFNFARYAEKVDSLDILPDWCRKTLGKHAKDERPALYTLEQLERAETHDALWNATQKEMLLRGKIHGYYRMYWGKKIIEWSRTYEEALRTMLHIHDVYALDGRDPNTYTNVLWCFGLHDRPWSERPVFGQIRYMSLDGMKRKTDVEAYIKQIEYLERTGKEPWPA